MSIYRVSEKWCSKTHVPSKRWHFEAKSPLAFLSTRPPYRDIDNNRYSARSAGRLSVYSLVHWPDCLPPINLHFGNDSSTKNIDSTTFSSGFNIPTVLCIVTTTFSTPCINTHTNRYSIQTNSIRIRWVGSLGWINIWDTFANTVTLRLRIPDDRGSAIHKC